MLRIAVHSFVLVLLLAVVVNGAVHQTTATCSQCTAVASKVVALVNNTASFSASVAEAKVFCNSLHSATDSILCDIVVDWAETNLPSMLALALHRLYHDIPKVACADLFELCTFDCCETAEVPEQIHLSFADSDLKLEPQMLRMRVTWVTLANVSQGVLVWSGEGGSEPTYIPEESTRTYTVGGWRGIVHTAVIPHLSPSQTYTYRVGSNATAFSQSYNFTTMPPNAGSQERPLRILTIADMGFTERSANTVRSMEAIVEAGGADFIIHSGDISYADGDETHKDVFWRRMESVAARIPYMTAPGNHERFWDFAAYRARAAESMPPAGSSTGAKGAMYYSLTVGPASMLILDSESASDEPQVLPQQHAWATQKMKEANGNRKERPWLLAFQHRPLYCTAPNFDCGINAAYLRALLEETYAEQKVDLVTQAHVHYWERMYPVVNGTLVNGKSYTKPTAPVYVVNGAAGNPSSRPLPGSNQPWSAFATTEIGYAMYTIVADPATAQNTLSVDFYSSATNRKIDSFVVSK